MNISNRYLTNDINMEESSGRNSSKTLNKSSNLNSEKKVQNEERKFHKREERLAIISVNSFEADREEEAHRKSLSKSNFF